LREPECATRRNRKSKPELHFIIFYLANTDVCSHEDSNKDTRMIVSLAPAFYDN
jgi:hypothetical protein